jgi:hypothetical protein
LYVCKRLGAEVPMMPLDWARGAAAAAAPSCPRDPQYRVFKTGIHTSIVHALSHRRINTTTTLLFHLSLFSIFFALHARPRWLGCVVVVVSLVDRRSFFAPLLLRKRKGLGESRPLLGACVAPTPDPPKLHAFVLSPYIQASDPFAGPTTTLCPSPAPPDFTFPIRVRWLTSSPRIK